MHAAGRRGGEQGGGGGGAHRDRERGARAGHVRRPPWPSSDGPGEHRARRGGGAGRGGRRGARGLRPRLRDVPVVGPVPGVDRRGGGRRGPVLPGAPHAGLVPVRRRGRGGGVAAVQPQRDRVEPRRVQAAGAPGGGAGGGTEGPAQRGRRRGRARGAAEPVRAHDGPVPLRRGGGTGGGLVHVQSRRAAPGGEAPPARGLLQPRHAALGSRRCVSVYFMHAQSISLSMTSASCLHLHSCIALHAIQFRQACVVAPVLC